MTSPTSARDESRRAQTRRLVRGRDPRRHRHRRDRRRAPGARGAGRARAAPPPRDPAVVGPPGAADRSSRPRGRVRLQRLARPTRPTAPTPASSSRGPTGSSLQADPDAPRIPASTLKILTATAAFDVLGADFKYETRAVAANKPGEDGVARADVAGRRGRSGAHDAGSRGGDSRTTRRPRATRSRRWSKLADDIRAAGRARDPRRHHRRRLPLRRHPLPVGRGRRATAPTARSGRSAR